MEGGRMRSFWDERARENAYFFVDDRLDYAAPDLERFWQAGEADLDRLLSMLGLSVAPTDTVVEIGCGVGRLTRGLASRARRVIALDISAEMLSRARVNLAAAANVEFVHGDGTTLAGIDAAVADACVSHVVFQHVPAPEIVYGYVREMGRVLKPGAWSGFQVSNDPEIHRRRAETLRGRIASALGRAPSGTRDPSWLGTAVDLARLTQAAESAGLAVQRLEGVGTQFCLVALRRGRRPA